MCVSLTITHTAVDNVGNFRELWIYFKGGEIFIKKKKVKGIHKEID